MARKNTRLSRVKDKLRKRQERMVANPPSSNDQNEQNSNKCQININSRKRKSELARDIMNKKYKYDEKF